MHRCMGSTFDTIEPDQDEKASHYIQDFLDCIYQIRDAFATESNA